MVRIQFVFLGVLFFLSTALAGQTIVIDANPGADVYGNGSQPDGSASQGLYYSAVNGNTVIINGGVSGHVFGAYAYDVYGPNTVADNSVTLNSGTVTEGVFGGYVHGEDGAVAATGNSVTLDNATVKASVSGGYAYNLQAGTATATGNSVTINSGSDLGSWYAHGGEAHVKGGSGTASANGNSVTINGGTAAGFFGGDASHDGDGTAAANNNRTTINGGMLGGSVLGGRATSSTGTATANGNSMFIRNGTVGSDVYGGFVTGDTGATATHNIVTLSDSPTFTAGRVNLYGGDGTTATGVSDFFTGNTLNVWNYSGSSVESVQNFELLNFVFPVIQGNTPVLTVDNAAVLGDSTQGKASIVTAGTAGGSTPLQAGDTVTLIDGTIDVSAGFNNQATGRHGATLRYKWELDAANGLVATLNGVQADQRAKALSEGFLSGLALATHGADLAAGAGMRQVVRATEGSGLNAFAAFSGGALRYDTGSHVDMNSFSLMTGLAKAFAADPGRLALAAFFEYGNGIYDTLDLF